MNLFPGAISGRHVARAMERLRLYLVNAPQGKFWLFFTASIFFNIGFSIFYFLFNIYLLGFGWTERSLGLIGSLMAVGSILGTIPAGRLAERFGLRWTLTLGVALAVVFSILRVCIAWQPAQLSLALLSGVVMCFWAVCLSPAVAALTTEQQRPFAFSLMFASGISIAGAGGLIAGLLPGWLIRADWLQGLRAHQLSVQQANQLTLLIGCAIAGLALIALSRMVLAKPIPQLQQPRRSNPFLWRFLPAMAVWGLVTGAFPPFANVYFVHHLGLSLERTGFVFSISQLAQFVAILGAPVLFRRTGLTAGVMLTQFATAATLVWLAAAHSAQLASYVYWAYMAVQCMNEPGIFSMLMKHTPEHQRSRASAATFFVSSASQAAASLAMGAAIVRFGYPMSIAAIAALAVLAAVLFRRLAGDVAEKSPPISESSAVTEQAV
jgi:MFS family permease